MARFKVNKRKSAGRFRKDVGRTKALNMKRPGRGGYRL